MAVKYCFDDVKTLLKKFKNTVSPVFLLNFVIASTSSKVTDTIFDL